MKVSELIRYFDAGDLDPDLLTVNVATRVPSNPGLEITLYPDTTKEDVDSLITWLQSMLDEEVLFGLHRETDNA